VLAVKNVKKGMTMSNFIETQDGSLILSSEIVKIQAGDDSYCTIVTRNGQMYLVDKSADWLLKNTNPDTVRGIPAEPGYFIVEAIPGEEDREGKVDDDDWETRFTPVVGWSPVQTDQSDYLFNSKPIIANQRSDIFSWALVWPDGKVVDPETGLKFESVEEWLTYVKEDYKEEE
jgi:hypothetical protein